jgi:hypothetical protein
MQADLQKHAVTVATTKEIERLKAELQVRHHEHVVRFGHIHERQAKILAKTFSLAVKLNKLTEEYLVPFPPRDDLAESKEFGQMHDAFLEFQSYTKPREIYFAPAAWSLIADFLLKISEITAQNIMSKKPDSDKTVINMEAVRRLNQEVLPLMNRIIEDFRRLLGTDLTSARTADSPDHDAAHQPPPEPRPARQTPDQTGTVAPLA